MVTQKGRGVCCVFTFKPPGEELGDGPGGLFWSQNRRKGSRSTAFSQFAMGNPAMRRVGWNTLLRPALYDFRGAVAEDPVMNHKADEHWAALLLEMAEDARQDGDFVTAELLVAAAMNFGEADRLAARWRKLEARLDDDTSRRPKAA